VDSLLFQRVSLAVTKGDEASSSISSVWGHLQILPRRDESYICID